MAVVVCWWFFFSCWLARLHRKFGSARLKFGTPRGWGADPPPRPPGPHPPREELCPCHSPTPVMARPLYSVSQPLSCTAQALSLAPDTVPAAPTLGPTLQPNLPQPPAPQLNPPHPHPCSTTVNRDPCPVQPKRCPPPLQSPSHWSPMPGNNPRQKSSEKVLNSPQKTSPARV